MENLFESTLYDFLDSATEKIVKIGLHLTIKHKVTVDLYNEGSNSLPATQTSTSYSPPTTDHHLTLAGTRFPSR